MVAKALSRLVLIGLLAVPLAAQEAETEYDETYGWDRPKRLAEPPRDGFWPTEGILNKFLDRLVIDEMAGQYDLDQDQIIATRELIGERIPGWMNENRAEIMTAFNYFLEAQLSDEPPTPERVEMWSRRVVPLMDDFRGVMLGVTEEMSTYLDDDQFARLETEMAGFNAAMDVMTNQVRGWAHGGYDPETDWFGRPGSRERAEREREHARQMEETVELAKAQARGDAPPAADGAPPVTAVAGRVDERRGPTGGGEAAAAKDEWDLYVEKFGREMEFNREQEQKAQHYLAAAKRERLRYHDNNEDKLARITKRLEGEDKEAAEAALKDFEEFNTGVERIFEKLKRNLNKLPTRAQWRKYEEARAETKNEKPASDD